ncbi:MAG TPA: DUF4139 domain-containing protein [Terriglobia bacterium]|nr:DUF4139 domain-containing protein [Terriglobia bacterium]
MPKLVIVFCLAVSTAALMAVPPAPTTKPRPAAPAVAAIPPVIKDLPVRKVVLYKNGVGYFEHAGSVTGNQQVAVDFTSAQLNDVLQSLTVLDEGGGRIAGVNYNSTTPLAEQLKSLTLGMGDDPTSTELFQAIRGQRVEVTGGPGGPGNMISGRLVSIESHTEKTGAGDTTIEKDYLTLVTASGGVRVIELTPALSVRPLDANLQGQLDRYLELLSSTRATGLRHLTLNAIGQGQRDVRVSYISEVPVWKSTYRIVFPRESTSKAVLQGWAVVDNTVGADWDNVQLALVAGAPQSFIQPLSQPLYARRPEIPISTTAMTTPQTHEAAESTQQDKINLSARLYAPQAIGANQQNNFTSSQSVAVNAGPGVAADTNGVFHGIGDGLGAGSGGGVYRPTDALEEGDISTNAFDDFFEYALTQPVTIHKNESAMVPILQQELPAEHVTLWSARQPRSLRAIWLKNDSKLTFDSGSFSIFESGEFAGEGLLDPIHPGERRLLSYAADRAVKVHRAGYAETHTLHHIAMHSGVLVETTSEVTENTYTVTNGADEARVVVVEHPRNPNSELESDTKPAETSATAYRFRVSVEPHQSVDLHIGERANLSGRIDINVNQFQNEYLVNVSKYTPELEEKLRPLIDAEVALESLNFRINENEQEEKTLSADEARARENLTALKGNEAAKRFVEELNRAEDEIQATRKDHGDLITKRDAARAHLDAEIARISFETDLSVVTQSTRSGGASKP